MRLTHFHRCCLTGAAALLAVLLTTSGALAQARVALVVGVGAYQAVPPLTNPANDATDLAASLTRLGFQVELVQDPDRPALEAAVRRLGQRARGAEAALFFYAGHALASGGRNWLLPTTARPTSERDLRFEALDLDSVLEQIEGAARLAIILLDACRDNPFRMRFGPTTTRQAGGGGLAQVRAAVGTLIAFATAPELVAEDGAGRNSPFTAALLRRIETPGLELRTLMAEVRREVREATQGRQTPWEHSALEGSFFFAAAPAAPPVAEAPRAPAPPPAATGREADILFWDSVRNSGSAAELRAYLARFPRGIYAELARSRLTALEPGAEPGRSLPAPVAAEVPPPSPAPIAVAPPSPSPPAPAAQPSAATAPPAPAQPPRPERLAVIPPPAPAAPARPIVPVTAASIRNSIPFLSADLANTVMERYGSAPLHRALAAQPERTRWWMGTRFAQPQAAEEVTLERCQIATGSPCVLIAVNDEIRGRVGAAPRRDMPRVRYAGAFLLDRTPGVQASGRQDNPALRDYATALAPRALVMHPWGRYFSAAAARNESEAERVALAACNADAERMGRDGPCFVYARGDRVVLPERRTAAR